MKSQVRLRIYMKTNTIGYATVIAFAEGRQGAVLVQKCKTSFLQTYMC